MNKQSLEAKEMNKDSQQEQSLEEAFLRLDALIGVLEDSDVTLEESFQKYQQGMELLKFCNEQIDRVEKKMLVINDHGEAHEF